jgi:hypothetical protein
MALFLIHFVGNTWYKHCRTVWRRKVREKLERMNKQSPRSGRVILTRTTVLMAQKFTTVVKG